MPFCTKCGSEVSETAKFCTKCGSVRGSVQKTQSEPKAPQIVPKVQVEPKAQIQPKAPQVEPKAQIQPRAPQIEPKASNLRRVEVKKSQKPKNPILYFLLGGGALLVIAAVVAVILVKRNGSDDELLFETLDGEDLSASMDIGEKPRKKQGAGGKPRGKAGAGTEENTTPGLKYKTFTDGREGKEYRIVDIGNQTWMAENLKFEASGSVCYENKSANCTKYGRLYDWNTAKKACPSGWRLPSKSEWETLDNAVGGEEVAGEKLKARNGWNNDGNGTDSYGFSGLPGGRGFSDGNFNFAGNIGFWWTATEKSTKNAYYRPLRNDTGTVSWNADGVNKGYLFSVRCVKN